MGLLNGLKKVKRYIKLPDGYKLLSIWTSSQSVEMDDGSTLESNKPNWDDKYTKSEVDNKLSAIETNIDWKESVDTFADITSAYPDPQDGWTVNVKDTDYTYRYSGEEWVVISANAIPKATQSVDGLLTKEDKISFDSAVTKKHEHINKSVLDGITSEKVERWDESSTSSVTGVKGNKEENYRSGNVNITPADIGAVDKSGDTMTGALTAPTFHGNLEGTFQGMSDKQIFRGGVEYGFNNGLSEDTTTWTTPGCYGVWSTCTGTPKEEPWGTLLVFPTLEGRNVQVYNDWNQPDELYYRSGGGIAWSGWKLMSNHSYAMCLDQPGTAAKTAASSNFCLRQYHRMTVYFVNGSNTISTLQINNDAARRVYYKAGGFDKTIPRGCFIDMIYIDGAWYVCGGVEEPANSVANAPLKCNTLPSNLTSKMTVSNFAYNSDMGYYNLYIAASDNLNNTYLPSGNGSGYVVGATGYYHLYIRAYMSTCSDNDRVKRLGIKVNNDHVVFDMKRATPYEIMEDSNVVYLTEGSIIYPQFQMDANGSTKTTATLSAVIMVLPLFVN